jgi:hypothetical protein
MSDGAAISGGSIDNATVGASAASSGIFTTLQAITSVTIGLTTGGANLLNVYAAAGNARLMQYFSGANLRWAHGANNASESGSNAGSAWELYAYSDASAYLSTPISVARATGRVTLSDSLQIGGGSGPTWTSGAGAPSSSQPNGSLYSRTDGSTGSRLYVSAGGGSWNAVSGV